MEQPPITAFVLGAGLGTRLRSLTAQRPKPLIPVCNEPLITRAFGHLYGIGVRRFIVNSHWQAHAYRDAFPGASWRDCDITFSHEAPEALETGGGLKHAEKFLPDNSPFWVYNGDILSDLPLQPALEAHSQSANDVTLVLRSRDGPLHVNFDESTRRIRDIGRKLLPHEDPRFLFTGIYIVNPGFLDRIPAKTKISVVPIFLEMIRMGAGVGGVVIDEGTWWDLGSREQILAVHSALAKGLQKPAPWISPDAQIHHSAKLLGACAVGPRVRIGAGAVLEDSIIWEDSVIKGPSRLTRCIVTSGRTVDGDHTDADL